MFEKPSTLWKSISFALYCTSLQLTTDYLETPNYSSFLGHLFDYCLLILQEVKNFLQTLFVYNLRGIDHIN